MTDELALSRRRLTGKEMRVLREELGFSQARLAALFGVRELTVARWEKQECQPPQCAEVLLRMMCLEEIGVRMKISGVLSLLSEVEDA